MNEQGQIRTSRTDMLEPQAKDLGLISAPLSIGLIISTKEQGQIRTSPTDVPGMLTKKPISGRLEIGRNSSVSISQ
jgi:hypothetical protein